MAVAVWNREAGRGGCLQPCGQIVEVVQPLIPKQILRRCNCSLTEFVCFSKSSIHYE